MNHTLLQQITKKDAKAFTHSGKFHADDVFSSALLLYLNPEITITRGSKVPEGYDGIVFDIGRGEYDHHQKDSRIRENGVPYAAFGLLWERLGAGMILENKFERYLGNERADKRIEEVLEAQQKALEAGEKPEDEAKILVLPEFIPCQKRLSETDIAFVIFPSNRGGYCIQPQKREYSMNYKCSFPEKWLGLENEELVQATGLFSAGFCHKGGFLMTAGTLEDAVAACKISLSCFKEEPVIVNFGGGKEADELLQQLPGMEHARISHCALPDVPELEVQGIYGEVIMEKQQWKSRIKDQVKQILKEKPEAVYVEGDVFLTYPVVHQLRKKHIPVLTRVERDGEHYIVRIPSGS